MFICLISNQTVNYFLTLDKLVENSVQNRSVAPNPSIEMLSWRNIKERSSEPVYRNAVLAKHKGA